jgi:hypothetical protein
MVYRVGLNRVMGLGDLARAGICRCVNGQLSVKWKLLVIPNGSRCLRVEHRVDRRRRERLTALIEMTSSGKPVRKIKIITTAFAIVMAMASAATAAERVKLPRQMLGTWCGVLAEWEKSDNERVFERGKCDPEDDTSILVGPDGYKGQDFSCKMIEISSKREGARVVYVMRNRCDGEGGVLVENLSMWLADNGSLILRWKR